MLLPLALLGSSLATMSLGVEFEHNFDASECFDGHHSISEDTSTTSAHSNKHCDITPGQGFAVALLIVFLVLNALLMCVPCHVSHLLSSLFFF